MSKEERYTRALDELRPILLGLPEWKKEELKNTNNFDELVEKLEQVVKEVRDENNEE